MLSRIRPAAIPALQFNPNPRIVLFLSIFGFPPGSLAAEPQVFEIEQGATDPEPVTVSRELNAVDAAITVTESGLELQKATIYRDALIPPSGDSHVTLRDSATDLVKDIPAMGT